MRKIYNETKGIKEIVLVL
ncbi:hypothetical protein [Roseburia porci]